MLPLLLTIAEIITSFAIVAVIWLKTDLKEPCITLLTFILGIILTDLAQQVKAGYRYIRVLPKLLMLVITNKPLRISFATLIRIKINNRYLLVKSKRNHYFQPPGGVLRFHDSTIKDRFKLSDDQSYKALKDDEFRLRFQPGGLWKFFGFLKWFDSQKSRELDPHREFYEELIDTQILDPNIFSKPQFIYIKRVVPPITYGTHFQIDEFFIFEIFEMILDKNQKDFIEKLSASKDFTLLSADEILRDGFNGTHTTSIGSHTKHIL